jgi:hypothetical protein
MRRYNLYELEKDHPIFALAQLFFTVQKDMLGYVLTIPMLKNVTSHEHLASFIIWRAEATPLHMQFDKSSHL